MNIALWVVQFILAGMFILAGSMKAFSYERAKANLPWAKDYSRGFVSFIGFVEVLGGIGLILPLALGILPVLTGFAALGLALIMLLAAIFHARRKENNVIAMNLIMLLLALFVAVGRFLG